MMPYSMMQQGQQPKSKYESEEETSATAGSVDASSLGPLVAARLAAVYNMPNNNKSPFFAPSSNNSAMMLSPHRHEALANYQSGVLSPSTPPVSRQRRHSKMHLRIASVDQQAESSYSNYMGDLQQPQQLSSFGSPSKTSSSVKSAISSSSTTSGGSAAVPAKPTKERYRIVLLGSSAVGKTAIVEQFLYGSFPETHCCTVEELHKGEYEIAGGQVVPLEILDTSGSFTFTAMRNLAIANGDAFALVYSIDSPESFEEVKTLRELILQLKGSDPSPPIVVVGNKADLPEERRQVKLEVAECECIDWESGFVECSAKSNKNIINIFSCMLIQARLKGSLNVDSVISASNSQRQTGYRDPASRAQRRRSSLPISELFHRSSRGDRGDRGGGLLDSAASNRISDPRNSSTFRKRNSCTPS